MACVLWSRVYLLGFALHSVCAATATPDSHFHTLSMLANTRQHSLLCCSSRCMQHIAVSHVVCAHNCKSVEMDSENDWYTDTHTCLSALFPGLPRWVGTRKVKPMWILLKQETVSGSGISWAIYKSAPCSRQPHQHPITLFFYRPDALPAAHPTASKHWRFDWLIHELHWIHSENCKS